MLPERKYSISEIDQLRWHVREHLEWQIHRGQSGIYSGFPDKAEIEDALRTYMVNGTTIGEFEALAVERRAERLKNAALRP